MDSLKQLMDYREFGAIFRDAATIDDMMFTNEFFTNPQTTWADKIEIVNVNATNTPGKANVSKNAPPRIVQPRDFASQDFKILRQSDEIVMPADALQAIREPDSQAMQRKGRFVVEEQVAHFGRQAALFKEVCIRNILTVGKLNFASDGTFLQPSVHATTGAVTDHADAHIVADYQIANSHRGNLGGTISALWSTASTKISDQLEAIQIAAKKAGAPEPTRMILNKEDKKYFRGNTEFKEWCQYNSARVDDVLRGEGFDNFFGWDVKFVNQYYTNPSDGVVTPIIPSKCALMLPASSSGWLRSFNGVEPVQIDPDTYFASASNALENLQYLEGMVAYAMIRTGPPVTLSAFFTENWGMGLADPNAVWIPTVFA